VARKVDWSDEAKTDIRRLDRTAAMRVFDVLLRFVDTGEGDVKLLEGQSGNLRLRAGDYRILFNRYGDQFIIHGVKHRRDAYR
jgi:mRNA-degrading endonuclease RelE of RelBE toxin-antitoxin system